MPQRIPLSSDTTDTPLLDAFAPQQSALTTVSVTPLLDAADQGRLGSPTPLLDEFSGQMTTRQDTLEALLPGVTQVPDVPIRFSTEPRSDLITDIVIPTFNELRNSIIGFARIGVAANNPVAAAQVGMALLMPEAAKIVVPEKEVEQIRSGAAFAASIFVGGITSTLTKPFVAAATTRAGDFGRGILASVVRGGAEGATFGAIRNRAEGESILEAILIDAVVFGGFHLGARLISQGTRPIKLSEDIVSEATGSISSREVGAMSYGQALAREAEQLSQALTTEGLGQSARGITIGAADITSSLVQRVMPLSNAANIGVLRRYVGSPSRWKNVGGPAGIAAERIVQNGIDREAVAIRLIAETKPIRDEAKQILLKGVPRRQRKEVIFQFGKLLDTIFDASDLPTNTTPNMRRAFGIMRDKYLGEREALRLLVGAPPDWGIDAYLPHVFVGKDWLIRNASTGSTLARTSLKELRERAQQLILENPNVRLQVVPERFAIPTELSGSGLTGQRLAIFAERAAKALSLEHDEVAQILLQNRIVRVSPSKKWFSHAKARRANLQDFELDPFVADEIYSVGFARKIAFHDFEQKTQAMLTALEREAGTAVNPTVSALKGYIDNVLGRPSPFEEATRATMQALAGPARVLGPGGLGSVQRILDPRFISRSITKIEAYSRLGYSPTAWFVNLSQTAVNTASAIGWRSTGRAIALLTDRTQRTQVDRILRALGVELQVPLSAADQLLTRELRKLNPWNPLYLFNRVETANRSIAGLAKFQDEILRGASPQQAITSAKQFIAETQFIYSIADTPQLMAGPLGAAAFQFKKFVVKEIEFLLNASPVQLARFTLNIQLIGGVSALMALPPGMLIDWAAGKLTGKTLTERLQEVAPRLSRGVPGLLGVDVSGSVAIGVPRDLGDVFGPGLIDLYTLAFDAAPKWVLDLVSEKKGNLSPDDRARILRQILPVMVRRGNEAIDVYFRGDVRTRTGALKFTPENPTREALLAAFGFRSLERAEEARITTITNRETQVIRKADEAVLEAWSLAVVDGDDDRAAEIMNSAAERGIIITEAQLQTAFESLVLPRALQRGRRAPIELREGALQRALEERF